MSALNIRLNIGLGILFLFLFGPLYAEPNHSFLKAETLRNEILFRRSKVSEFIRIEKMARNYGLRVFLFGGAASSFANYVRWDLERRNGRSELKEVYFNYDWDRIYKSSQDLDLAVSAFDEKNDNQKNIEQFEKALVEEFPALRIDIHRLNGPYVNYEKKERPSLLGNSDFISQNGDSVSTGLIELTSSSEIMDLRSAASEEALFLRDLSLGQIKFLESATHADSSRSRAGINPAMFSVIRYFVNALRYDLKLLPEDQTTIQNIISDFDPNLLLRSEKIDYLRNWLKANTRKMVSQTVDLERAYTIINSFNLREKLAPLDDEAKKVGSLDWILSRLSLPSDPAKISALNRYSKKTNKTASDLSLTTITHQTSSLEAFEQITGNPFGRANFFISIEDNGQHARYGSGFYALEGMRGTHPNSLSYHIVMSIKPIAKEGEDFELVNSILGKIVLGFNREVFEIDLNKSKTSLPLSGLLPLAKSIQKDPFLIDKLILAGSKLGKTRIDEEEIELFLSQMAAEIKSENLYESMLALMSIKHPDFFSIQETIYDILNQEYLRREGKSFSHFLTFAIMNENHKFRKSRWIQFALHVSPMIALTAFPLLIRFFDDLEASTFSNLQTVFYKFYAPIFFGLVFCSIWSVLRASNNNQFFPDWLRQISSNENIRSKVKLVLLNSLDRIPLDRIVRGLNTAFSQKPKSYKGYQLCTSALRSLKKLKW